MAAIQLSIVFGLVAATVSATSSPAAVSASSAEPLGSPTEGRSGRRRRFVYFPTGSTVTVSMDLLLPIGTSGASITLSPSINFQPTTIIGRHHYHRRAAERTGLLNMATDAFSQVGLNGDQCLSRMICEASSAPFHEDGLLGDVVNTIFLDGEFDSMDNEIDTGLGAFNSSSKYQNPSKWHSLYNAVNLREARSFGATNGDCSVKYRDCPVSVFNIL